MRDKKRQYIDPNQREYIDPNQYRGVFESTVRPLIETSGYTISQIAELADIERKTFYRYLGGERFPMSHEASKLAQALNIDYEDLKLKLVIRISKGPQSKLFVFGEEKWCWVATRPVVPKASVESVSNHTKNEVETEEHSPDVSGGYTPHPGISPEDWSFFRTLSDNITGREIRAERDNPLSFDEIVLKDRKARNEESRLEERETAKAERHIRESEELKQRASFYEKNVQLFADERDGEYLLFQGVTVTVSQFARFLCADYRMVKRMLRRWGPDEIAQRLARRGLLTSSTFKVNAAPETLPLAA